MVACAPMRSNVNLSNIARTASSCGAARLIACGAAKIIGKIARDAAETLPVEVHRTLGPPLAELRRAGYQIVGLEQTNASHDLHRFRFERRTVLVVGNERLGLTEDILTLLDHAVEIPVYGLPYSYNVATATAMALYEFCRQFPSG
ncbi:MAG: TrmH family RNA methyltransferase [Planctomycetes bacterium]|nr:TrmH family RNA methyltransferase [Planctomycetota bacterium]